MIECVLDRSQSDFYFVPQEIQTDTATPLSMEIFGRIDFSLGKLITRVTKNPKPTKQHVTWAVELVRIFFIHFCGRGSHFPEGHFEIAP